MQRFSLSSLGKGPSLDSRSAEAAHVSVGTVPRVLNGQEGNSKNSKTNLTLHGMEEALRPSYQPNLFATALRTQRTGVL